MWEIIFIWYSTVHENVCKGIMIIYSCFNHTQDHSNRCSELAVRLMNRLYHTPWLGSLMPHFSLKSLMGIHGISVFTMEYVYVIINSLKQDTTKIIFWVSMHASGYLLVRFYKNSVLLKRFIHFFTYTNRTNRTNKKFSQPQVTSENFL